MVQRPTRPEEPETTQRRPGQGRGRWDVSAGRLPDGRPATSPSVAIPRPPALPPHRYRPEDAHCPPGPRSHARRRPGSRPPRNPRLVRHDPREGAGLSRIPDFPRPTQPRPGVRLFHWSPARFQMETVDEMNNGEIVLRTANPGMSPPLGDPRGRGPGRSGQGRAARRSWDLRRLVEPDRATPPSASRSAQRSATPGRELGAGMGEDGQARAAAAERLRGVDPGRTPRPDRSARSPSPPGPPAPFSQERKRRATRGSGRPHPPGSSQCWRTRTTHPAPASPEAHAPATIKAPGTGRNVPHARVDDRKQPHGWHRGPE
jgi:hypothetical protein